MIAVDYGGPLIAWMGAVIPQAPRRSGVRARWGFGWGDAGSDVTRRGRNVEGEACFSVARLQDLLDEWLVHRHQRPHEGLRHPVMPRVALTPTRMWVALVAAFGYVSVPLTGGDYLELLPVRWQAVTERGIRIDHRTYDCDLLGPFGVSPPGSSPETGSGRSTTTPTTAAGYGCACPSVGSPRCRGSTASTPTTRSTTAPGNSCVPPSSPTPTPTSTRRTSRKPSTNSCAAPAPEEPPAPDDTSSPAGHPPGFLHRHAPCTKGRSRTSATAPRGKARRASTNSTTVPTRPHRGWWDTDETDPDSPAPPYTGYGLYDAHEEALKW
ncbi:transposase [Embleya hyalina]|uniref:Transposase n=1 Tax=Embleya hyalina TaxID=516124 RepID=A0A401Z759_9ACTN|nr:transposase [Embleya hyalina]